MTQALKRGLFGFNAESVRSVLAEREQMFARVVQDVRAAETRVDEITAALETALRERDFVHEELQTTREERDTARAERDVAQTELEAAREQRDAANTERDGLLAVLATRRSERDSARAALTERERMLEELTARANRLEAEIETVGADLREHAERTRAANADALSARTELETVRRDLSEREAKIADLEAEIERLGADSTAERPEADVALAAPIATTSDDLSRVLRETESTMSRMVAEARWSAENELTEVVRRREDVRAEIDGLVAWRDRIAPLAQGVHDLLGEAQARTAEVDERLHAVLEPMTTTMGALRGRLTELVEVADMGDITSPGSVEEDALDTSETPRTAVILVEEETSVARHSPW